VREQEQGRVYDRKGGDRRREDEGVSPSGKMRKVEVRDEVDRREK
jgi:hypothetical protein